MGRYDDGELPTLITLAKEIIQSCLIRNLPQGKREERAGRDGIYCTQVPRHSFTPQLTWKRSCSQFQTESENMPYLEAAGY